MRVCCLASGSSGNCTYVETEKAKILIDCGISVSALEKRLAEINVNPALIDAVLVTHEHIDHVKSVAQLRRKYKNILPYVYYKNSSEVRIKTKLKIEEIYIIGQRKIGLKDAKITILELSHDSQFCVGYMIEDENACMAIITDTGYIPSEALNELDHCNLIVIEANHNVKMLENNPNYPIETKRRILSRVGHLSNKQCAEYMYTLILKGCRQFVLAHLSENNNTPKLAYCDVAEYLLGKDLIEGKHYFIDLAWQNKKGTLYSLKKQ